MVDVDWSEAETRCLVNQRAAKQQDIPQKAVANCLVRRLGYAIQQIF